MKKSLFAIAALAVAGLGFAGCDVNTTNPDSPITDACNNTCTEDEKCLTTSDVVNITEATCFAEDKITDDECANGLQLNDDESLTCAEAQACGDTTCEVGTYCTTALNGEGVEEQGCATAAVPDCESKGMLAEWQDDMTVLCITADVRTCTDDSGCEDGYICDDTEKVCVEGTRDELGEYKFVRIDDLTNTNEACCGEKDGCGTPAVCTKEDPGADIDAIALKKADGSVTYAKRVVEYKNNFIEGGTFYKEGNKMALDPSKALNEPNSLFEYATEAGLPADNAKCRYVVDGAPADPDYTVEHYTFVSLGGEGGYLIVEMDKKVENDDTVDVLEVGDCEMITSTGGNLSSSNVPNEKISIQVSVNGENGWVVINDGASATNGLISTKVTGL